MLGVLVGAIALIKSQHVIAFKEFIFQLYKIVNLCEVSSYMLNCVTPTLTEFQNSVISLRDEVDK